VILGPGESHAHYSARGSEMFFKATAELDGGDLSLMERTLPPGGRRPPARRHTNCSEAYFVLDGRVSIIVEGEELTVGREGFVLVPRVPGRSDRRDCSPASPRSAVQVPGSRLAAPIAESVLATDPCRVRGRYDGLRPSALLPRNAAICRSLTRRRCTSTERTRGRRE